MYVRMSREHSDDGLFDFSILDINSKQTKKKVAKFDYSYQTSVISSGGERERERAREICVLFETTSTYRIRILSF